MSKLFRTEVIAHRTERLGGDISLAVPIGWQAVGYLFLATLIVSAVFLFSANYPRIETVSGMILPDKGVTAVVPSRPGVITQLLVQEGQDVRVGTALAMLSSAELLEDGTSASGEMEKSLAAQDASLLTQSAGNAAAANAELARLSAQRAGLKEELVSLSEQRIVQQSLVSSAKRELEQVKEVAQRGFISRRDMLVREEQLAVRTQQLAQIEQSMAGKSATLSELQSAAAQAAAQSKAQSANMLGSREQVARQRIDVNLAAGYILTATSSGKVTAVTAKVGQMASPNAPLLSIVPSASKLRAEIPVPATMIGFLSVGQPVSLSIDAFPYQQFGTVAARIIVMPSAAISSADAKGNAMPVYPVIAEISQPHVLAFGKKQPLLSGMTFSARITTREQSLLQWLFEPLYAVGRR